MKFVVATLVLLFFFCLPVNAQVAGGSITGTVTGESGAAMPDVRISVKDVSTGLARTATTNTAGLYSVPDLSPGNFEMTVSASGFTTQLWTSIAVTAGVERVLNVVMRCGRPAAGGAGRSASRAGQRAVPRGLRKRQCLHGSRHAAQWARLGGAGDVAGRRLFRAERERHRRGQHGSRVRSGGEHFRIAAGPEQLPSWTESASTIMRTERRAACSATIWELTRSSRCPSSGATIPPSTDELRAA